jgi:hypothetical protein
VADERGVTFHDDGIAHLLQDLQFQVPTHQRSYKWERLEHVRQLFVDIQDAMDDKDSDTYFLGMIVLKRGASPKERYEVIDGQQRLATVSIFLAAVRDYFQSLATEDGNRRAAIIQRKFLAEEDPKTLLYQPRLHLNTEDKQFFQANVVDSLTAPTFKRRDNPKSSHRKIANAILEAKKQVADIVDKGSLEKAGERLLEWVDYLEEKARVITISVPSEQNAYTLFETLNDRGLELTKADLIKNHLFGRAGSTSLEEVRQCWTEMTSQLESEDVVVDYIRHYWVSRHEFVRTKQLYAKVKPKTYTARAASDTAASLRNDAKLYAALSNPESDLWQDYPAGTANHAATLNAIGVAVITPLALSVLRKFGEGEMGRAFHLFVNWSVRFLISGGHRSETVEKPFAECAIEVSEGKVTTAKEMSKRLNSVVPQDDLFRDQFGIAQARGKLARYILRAIENKKDKVPNYEWIANPNAEEVDLEHVLPQSPSKDWKVTREDIEALRDRIGNLAIMPKAMNAKLANKSFAEKCAVYSSSSYHYTSWIAGKSAWGAAEIEERQLLLADEAVKVWPLTVR